MIARTDVARRDDGFTLVEMLISIALMGIIMSALALAFSFMLDQTRATQARLEVSSDVQLATAYFAEDVASVGVRDSNRVLVQSIEQNVSATGGIYPCSLATGTLPPATVRLAWDELAGGATEASTRVIVSYVVVQSGSESQLHRVVCRGSATAQVDQIVVHNLSTTTPPAAVCDSTCTGATPPKLVHLNMTIVKPGEPGPLAVKLTGQRRQS